MRWHPTSASLLLLLAAVVGCSAYNYQLDGNLAGITAADIAGIQTSRSAFYPYEQQIASKFESLLGTDYEDFFVDNFEIHGEDAGKPTAIFHGYLNTTLDRADLLKTLTDEQLTMFYVLKVDSVPIAPSLVASAAQSDATTQCLNGGLLLPNRTCACPSYYNGDQCLSVNCLHHGIQDVDRCACPPGVYAANCQPTSCMPSVQDTMDSTIQTFIVVVNIKSSMGYIVNQLAADMPALILSIQKQNPYLTTNYILYTYGTTTTNYYGMGYYFTDSDQFLDALNGITLINGTPDQPTNRAVLAAQQTFAGMRGFSNVFVFADSPDSDGTQSTNIISSNEIEMEVMLATNAWRNRIIYILAQFDDNPIDTFGTYYDVFRRISMGTLGDLVIIDYKEIDKVIDVLLYYYQRNEVVLALYQHTADYQGVVNGDTDQQEVNILITVEPNGTQPLVINHRNESLLAATMGKRFSLYRATEASTDTITVKGGTKWSMRQWIQDSTTVLIGYHMDRKVDVGYAMNFGEIRPYVTAAVLGDSPTTVSLTSIDLITGAPFSTLTSTVRSGPCTFPFTFQPDELPCDQTMNRWGIYGQQLKYVSTAGINITRIIPGYCGKLDHHESIAFTCFNGGTKAGRNKCNCLAQWTGQNCEVPKCLNGGKVNEFPGNGNPLCVCPQGYKGDLCDVLSCTLQSPDSFDYSQRTLAVVIQSSASQADINAKILTGLKTLLNTLKGSDAFSEYVLTTFNTVTRNGANASQVMTTRFQTSTGFLNALQPEQIGYKPSQATTQDSLGALYSTIRGITNARSSIFMFTDAPAAQTLKENDIIEYTVEGQLEVNTIITPPYNQMQLGLCMAAGDSSSFMDISMKTGGIYMNLCNPYGKYSQDPIVQMFINYGTVHHHTEKVVEGNSPDRSCNDTLSFFVDDPTTNFYLIVNSDQTEKFTVSYINQDDASSSTLQPISNMPFLGIYPFNPASVNQNGYSVSISPGPQTTMGECTMKLVEKTTTSVTLAFAVDPSWDDNSKGILYSLNTHPVVHIDPGFQARNPNITLSIQDNLGAQVYYSVPTIRSDTCQYQYFFDTYVCDKLFDFITMTFTAQFTDMMVQRSMRAYCYIGKGVCYNGGRLTNTSSCDCSNTGYIGNNCQFPICQNGGTQNKFACNCPLQYTGNLCQYPICSDFNFMEDTDVREENYKQITFITDNNKDQLLTNIFINQIMPDFVQQSEQTLSPKQYTLVTYDENGYSNLVSSAHVDVFLAKVKTFYSPYTNTTPAATQSMDALYNSYSLNIDPPNIIFLFTGQQPASPTIAKSMASIRQQLGTQVNVFYTPQTPAPLLPVNGNNYLLPTVVRQSGGRLMSMQQFSVASMSNMLASAISENALIHDDGAKDCSNGTVFSFYVEDGFESLVITATGANVGGGARVIATDAGGNVVPLSSTKLFTDPNSVSFSVPSTVVIKTGGQWSVTITTDTGACFCQVRAKTPLYIIPGFTSGLNQDFIKALPFASHGTDMNNYVAFRVKNSVTPITLNKLIISSTDFEQPWSKPTVLNTLLISTRDPFGCAFQFITEQFQQNKAQFQKFVVFGSDKNNTFTFQRTFFYNTNSDETKTCQFGTRNTNGECICDSTHTGDYCSTRICQNGGTPSTLICVCPNGYYGDYCEDYVSDEGLVTPSAAPATSSAAPKPQTSSAPPTTGAPVTNPVTIPPASRTAVPSTSAAPPSTMAPATSGSTAPPATSTFGPSSSPPKTSAVPTTTGPASAPPSTSGPASSSVATPSAAPTTTGPTSAPPSTAGPTSTFAPLSTSGPASTTVQPSTSGPTTLPLTSVPTTIPTTSVATVPPATSTAIPTSTTVPGTTGTTTKGPCDPLWTTYLVNNFIDVTGRRDDIANAFKAIVTQLATTLGVDSKKSYTRFIITGASNTVPSSDDCSDMACINVQLNYITAVTDYPSTNLTMGSTIQQTIDSGEDTIKSDENPGFALIMLNNPSTDNFKPSIQKLQQMGYVVYGIDGTAGANPGVVAQLKDALGEDNVDQLFDVTMTANWIVNKMQAKKCNGPPMLFKILGQQGEERN